MSSAELKLQNEVYSFLESDDVKGQIRSLIITSPLDVLDATQRDRIDPLKVSKDRPPADGSSRIVPFLLDLFQIKCRQLELDPKLVLYASQALTKDHLMRCFSSEAMATIEYHFVLIGAADHSKRAEWTETSFSKLVDIVAPFLTNYELDPYGLQRLPATRNRQAHRDDAPDGRYGDGDERGSRKRKRAEQTAPESAPTHASTSTSANAPVHPSTPTAHRSRNARRRKNRHTAEYVTSGTAAPHTPDERVALRGHSAAGNVSHLSPAAHGDRRSRSPERRTNRSAPTFEFPHRPSRRSLTPDSRREGRGRSASRSQPQYIPKNRSRSRSAGHRRSPRSISRGPRRSYGRPDPSPSRTPYRYSDSYRPRDNPPVSDRRSQTDYDYGARRPRSPPRYNQPGPSRSGYQRRSISPLRHDRPRHSDGHDRRRPLSPLRYDHPTTTHYDDGYHRFQPPFQDHLLQNSRDDEHRSSTPRRREDPGPPDYDDRARSQYDHRRTWDHSGGNAYEKPW